MIACAEVALHYHPLTVKIVELFVGHSVFQHLLHQLER